MAHHPVPSPRAAAASAPDIAGDVGEGPVVILLHGIASSAATFRHVIPLIEDRHRCISLDLLGFGESPAPEGATYTIEEHVAAINATIESLKLTAPFVLVGHSLGSLLAARYAAQYPKLVSRLVLVSPPVYIAPSAIGNPPCAPGSGPISRPTSSCGPTRTSPWRRAATLSKIFNLGTALEVTDRNWNPFILSLQNCIESQTTVSDIAAVRVPIDVVYGALDQFIARGTMSIIEQMRHVTMHRVEVNDHLVRPRLARVLAQVIS